MATSVIHGAASPLLVVGETGGITVIEPSTPLKRLNYFDGKLLRADDFNVEQRYLRELVALSNQGLGPGVVYGYDTTQGSGDNVHIGPGLAIDPSGRVLLMQSAFTHSIQGLIDASRKAVEAAPDASGKPGAGAFGDCVEVVAPPPTTVVAPASNIYVIAICSAEAFCGTQDVYGKLCEEACVTSTDRPYRLDGVVVRAIPLQLMTPFPVSKAVAIDANMYLRSKVAHSWYLDEQRKHPHAISRDGLLSHVWCLGAGYNTNCCEVPLAVVARAGSTTVFLDAWIIRRERMDAPSRRYWQWKMMMRPWDVYLAHILQFQCHLADVLAGIPVPGDRPEDPCASHDRVLSEAAQFVEQVRSGLVSYRKVAPRATASERPALLSMSLANVADLRDRIQRVVQGRTGTGQPTDRILIRNGILETPSAAYLPVLTGTDVTVNQQVRALLGDGVDLRFCVVRPDFVAHALEEAQHMERISLIAGLDDPAAKPAVDVLVPNGQVAADVTAASALYEMRLNILPQNLVLLAEAFLAGQAGNTRTAGNIRTAGNTRMMAGKVSNVTLAAASMFARAADTLETFEYSGAARGEETPDRHIAFHYAGTTGLFTLGLDRPQAGNTLQPSAEPSAQPATQPAAQPAPPPAMFDAPAAAFNLAATRTDMRISAVRGPQVRSSVWITMDLAADPATRARGDAVAVKFEQMVLLSLEADKTSTRAVSTQVILLRGAFTGELQIERNDTRPGGEDVREVSGVLTGELALSYRQNDQERNDGNSLTLYLSENVRILRTIGQFGPTFRIEMPQPSLFQPMVVEIEARREWKSTTRAEAGAKIAFALGSDQLRVEAAATKARQTTRQAFTAWQTINPAVQEPNHAAHESAIRALRSIGSALGAGKFADIAAKRLFPPPSPAGSDLRMYATLDWVLFHRRREKTCRKDQPGSPVATRQYALYQAPLTANQTVADLARLLQRAGAQGEGLPALNFVQLVEFEAGIHALASPHAQVQAAWRQDAGTSDTIDGGIIASRGVALAEGERLANERLEAVAEVIGAVAPVDVHPDYEVLTRVPDTLDAPSNDGIIVLATKKAVVASNCHDIVGVERDADLQGLVTAAQQGRFEDALAALKSGGRLGKVNFTGTTPEAATLTAVTGAWTQFNVGKPTVAAVIARTTDTQSNAYPAQGAAVLAALGGSGTPALTTTVGVLSGCPAVTIVAGEVALRNALLVYASFDIEGGFMFDVRQPTGAAPTMQFRNNVPQGNALQNYINALDANHPVNVVMLATNGAVDPGAGTRLAAVVAAVTKPPNFRSLFKALTDQRREELKRLVQDPAGFQDVIFFSAINLEQPDNA